MSIEHKTGLREIGGTEQTVADYLTGHPDFLKTTPKYSPSCACRIPAAMRFL